MFYLTSQPTKKMRRWTFFFFVIFILLIFCGIFATHWYLLTRLSEMPDRLYFQRYIVNETEFRDYPEFSIVENANHLYSALYGIETRQKYETKDTLSSHTSIVTQMSVDRLARLIWLVERWPDQISVAFYLPGLPYFIDFLQTLNSTHPILFQDRIHLHLVSNRGETQYPLNKLRNLAWKYSRTEFIFSLDLDFLPVEILPQILNDLAIHSQELLNRLILNKIVLVIPAFDYVCHNPQDISSCYKLKDMPGINQRATSTYRWVHAWKPFRIKYEMFYEPYIIGHRNLPRYDESFEIGNDKVEHAYEVEAAGYEWWVVNKAYVAHVPHDKTMIWSLHHKDYDQKKAWVIWWQFATRIYHQYHYNYVCRAKYYGYHPPDMEKYCASFR